MDLELENKVAVVTGGAAGLGAAMVEAFLREGAGVLVVDRDQQRVDTLVRKLRPLGRVEGHHADVSTPSFADGVVETAIGRLGGLDVLVNNAAIYPSKKWDQYSVKEFDEVMATNVRALFVLAKAAVPVLVDRGGGSIVNIGSLTFIAGFARILPYVTSKGGVVGFTRALARELGEHKIRVNAVSPGAFPTGAETIHPDRDAYSEFVLERQALKFRGTPQDLASMVVFLASERSRFVTGQTIGVDGGWVHT